MAIDVIATISGVHESYQIRRSQWGWTVCGGYDVVAEVSREIGVLHVWPCVYRFSNHVEYIDRITFCTLPACDRTDDIVVAKLYCALVEFGLIDPIQYLAAEYVCPLVE